MRTIEQRLNSDRSSISELWEKLHAMERRIIFLEKREEAKMSKDELIKHLQEKLKQNPK